MNILYISKFVLTDMPQEVWGKLADEYSELREKLILLGANENTASVLLCLHYHGASTSKELQSQCNIRQPDVSMAISDLRDMNLCAFFSSVRIVKRTTCPHLQTSRRPGKFASTI